MNGIIKANDHDFDGKIALKDKIDKIFDKMNGESKIVISMSIG
jgi:hypothetical protein